jgi:hypothetical protein
MRNGYVEKNRLREMSILLSLLQFHLFFGLFANTVVLTRGWTQYVSVLLVIVWTLRATVYCKDYRNHPPPQNHLHSRRRPTWSPCTNHLLIPRIASDFVKNNQLTALFGNNDNYVQTQRHNEARFVGQKENLRAAAKPLASKVFSRAAWGKCVN